MDPLPLDHIRLLHIEAGADESPIRCGLVITGLEAAPPYEALSYTWGSTEQDSTIVCDNAPKFVTENLYDALKYLRNAEHERIMWVDAVCINQSNDRERTEQVAIMKVIYAKASRVVIWLGRETVEDEGAFSLLNNFKELFAKHGSVKVGPSPGQSLGFPPYFDPQWASLVRLFQREWFQRIWVVQEATMACEAIVVCGSYSVSWEDLSKFAQSIRHHGHIGPYPVDFPVPRVPGIFCTILVNYLNIAHKTQDKTWDILGILRLTRKYRSTDPRDKVFALAGVVTNLENMSITADYRLSTEEVYLSVAVHYLENLKDMDILGNAGVGSAPQNPKLPSWVPDWSHDNDRRALLSGVARRRGMCASGDTQPTLSISADSKILTVRGAIIDTISHINTTILIGEEDAQLDHGTAAGMARIGLRAKISFEGYLDFAEAAHKFPAGHGREESLWRTLCCDMTTEIPSRRAPAEYAKAWTLVRQQLQATGPDGSLDWSKIDKQDLIPENQLHYVALMNSIGVETAGKNLCVTAGGYLGHVFSGSQIGDKICILFGAYVPFVLREEKDGFYRLVGECYLHGVMDGEVMKEQDIEALTRDFQLL